MDTAEYEQVKKEHAVAAAARNLTGPLITGVVTAGGIMSWLAGPWGTAVMVVKETLFLAIGFGSLALYAHEEINRCPPEKKMVEGRADRLTVKIHMLADRIATLEHRGGYPRELTQLRIAHDCFARHLQTYSNKITVQRV